MLMLFSPRNLMLASLLAVTMGPPAAAQTHALEDSVNDFAERTLLEQAQRQGWLAPQLRLSAAAKPRSVSPCPSGWQIEALDTRYLSRLRFAAHCAGQPSQQLQLRAQLSAEVLVAATALSAGQLIGEADVALERRDISNAPEALSQFDAVVGLSPRSSLRPGQLLQKRQLQAAVLVRRGQKVAIVARQGGIEVQAAGEALEAGAQGAQIRVRNLGSGRVIAARVLDIGQVEPALP
jgi:flagellar basal body P-ring formation protein FlgA